MDRPSWADAEGPPGGTLRNGPHLVEDRKRPAQPDTGPAAAEEPGQTRLQGPAARYLVRTSARCLADQRLGRYRQCLPQSSGTAVRRSTGPVQTGNATCRERGV